MKVASRRVSNYSLALLAIVLIGLFLRLYHLGTQSIWVDEVFSLKMSEFDLLGLVGRTALYDNSPPLYYIPLHYMILIFGTSEFAIRLLSALFGVLAIPVIYLVGRQLFDKEAGLMAALILAFSSFNVQYSQEARMYTLMVLLALLSMYFFLRVLRRSTLATSAGYILTTTLLLYTHYYGLLIVLAQNLYVVILLLLSARDTFRLRQWVTLEVLVVILFAPWMYVFANRVVLTQVYAWFWIPLPTLNDLISTFVVNAGSVFLSILFIALSVIALFRFTRAKGSWDWKSPLKALAAYSWNVKVVNVASVLFLVVWLFALNVIPFAMSYVKQPIYYPRYTIAASVALYVLVAGGIRNIKWNYARLVVIGLIVMLSAVSLQSYYVSNGKGDAREATNLINANAKSGDIVLFVPSWPQSIFEYYNSRTDVAVKPIGSWAPSDTEEHERLISNVTGHDRVWLFASPTSQIEKARESFILNVLNESYEQISAKNFDAHHFGASLGPSNNYHVYLYEKRS